MYGGVDIAGHGEVEEKEGFARAFTEGLLDGLIGEDVTGCGGGADDDIKAVVSWAGKSSKSIAAPPS